MNEGGHDNGEEGHCEELDAARDARDHRQHCEHHGDPAPKARPSDHNSLPSAVAGEGERHGRRERAGDKRHDEREDEARDKDSGIWLGKTSSPRVRNSATSASWASPW